MTTIGADRRFALPLFRRTREVQTLVRRQTLYGNSDGMTTRRNP